jgi:prostaglandin-H2 D-isomerase / glutathione transferase
LCRIFAWPIVYKSELSRLVLSKISVAAVESAAPRSLGYGSLAQETEKMAKLKLTYFDFHGGRGEVARLALSIGGLAFEDERLSFPSWKERKPAAPFGGLPLLEVDGQILTQSNAINRYVGKLVDLYPSDPWQAALCDEVMDAVEDIGHRIVATFELPDAEKKIRREAMVDGVLALYLRTLGKRLGAAGNAYFAGGRLSVADLKVFVWIRYLKSGQLDHVPTDIVDRFGPALVEHWKRIGEHSGVRAYYAKHGISG